MQAAKAYGLLLQQAMKLHALVLAGVVALVAGCAAPAEEDTSGSDDALTYGSRWRSSLKVGDYDADALSLHVFTWADRQWVDFQGAYCEGAVDVSSGKMSVSSEHCRVELAPAANGGIRLNGMMNDNSYDVVLERREANALVGEYATSYGFESTITVESSGDGTFTLSAKRFDDVIASHAKATAEGVNGVTGVYFQTFKLDAPALRDCLVSVQRRLGDYGLTFIDGRGGSCPVKGSYRRQ
jgi:hypothetical protein